MPLVILDGPEAAGKSTIIDRLMGEWGPNSVLRSWGPRDSWLEYCQPLWEDLLVCQSDPQALYVWSRCWASRTVYNQLLNQGQIVPPEVTKELDRIVTRAGGFLGMVTAPEVILLQRRLNRVESGFEKKDHQLDVGQELASFLKYARNRPWTALHGVDDPIDNVRKIITDLVRRNPECRYALREEDARGS